MSDVPWERGWRKGKIGETKETVLKNLLEFKEVMDKHGVPFMFIMGTLLGAMREKDFIHWDDDIDLIVLDEHKDTIEMAKVKTEMRERGYWVPIEGMPAYDNVFIKDGEKIEIWYYERIGDYRVYDCDRCHTIYFEADLVENQKEIDFLGHKFIAPLDTTTVLNRIYGPNWMTPIENAPNKANIVANIGKPFNRKLQRPYNNI